MKLKTVLSPASWVIIIIATLLTGYLYWFYTHFEIVITEEDIGAIKEARVNPFYAAEKFLEKSGKKASSHKSYALVDTYNISSVASSDLDTKTKENESLLNLHETKKEGKNDTENINEIEVSENKLEAYDTLIIESNRVGLSESKRVIIKEWLSAGGHLVVLATELYDDELSSSRDVLLDELGLRLYNNPDVTWEEDESDELTKVSFEDTKAITEIHFNNHYYIQDSNDEATLIGGNESTDFFAQYKVDEGMITVITDMNIWKNDLIAKHDHAMFLYQLVGGADQVWFLYNTVQPSLISIMIELIPLVVISFLIIIIFILFSASWRKGTPKDDDERIQREFMLHIEAAGEFSYRNDDGFLLLKGLMDALELKLRKSIHQYKKLSIVNKILKLSQLTGMNKEELEILWHENEMTQDHFIQKVVLIQEIRKRI